MIGSGEALRATAYMEAGAPPCGEHGWVLWLISVKAEAVLPGSITRALVLFKGNLSTSPLYVYRSSINCCFWSISCYWVKQGRMQTVGCTMEYMPFEREEVNSK